MEGNGEWKSLSHGMKKNVTKGLNQNYWYYLLSLFFGTTWVGYSVSPRIHNSTLLFSQRNTLSLMMMCFNINLTLGLLREFQPSLEK